MPKTMFKYKVYDKDGVVVAYCISLPPADDLALEIDGYWQFNKSGSEEFWV